MVVRSVAPKLVQAASKAKVCVGPDPNQRVSDQLLQDPFHDPIDGNPFGLRLVIPNEPVAKEVCRLPSALNGLTRASRWLPR